MIKTISLAFLLLAPQGSFAQDNGDIPSRFIRYIALGDAPPFKQKIENGIRKQVAAPPGSKPPSIAKITGLIGADGVNLRLGSPTSYYEIDGSQSNANLYNPKNMETPWVKSRMPKRTFSVGILMRNPAANPRTWDRAGIRTLADDLKAFPNKHIRFVNMTNGEAAYQFNEDKPVSLKKGEVKVVPVPSNEFSLIVRAKGKGGRAETLYQNIFEVGNRERACAYLYPADGRRADQVNRLRIFSEIFRLPKPAKKKRAAGDR